MTRKAAEVRNVLFCAMLNELFSLCVHSFLCAILFLYSFSLVIESSLELTGVSEVGQEGTEFLDSQASLEPESLNASLEEAVKSSGPDNPISVTDRDSKEAPLLNVSAKSK